MNNLLDRLRKSGPNIMVLVISIIIVVTNFLVDVSYGWIDPRIRHR